ncbi:MAG: hypothetical protein N3E45_07120 [Oscillatoriaceae bacterium SKW80]|nr:hypothetical protein [Oscillatoriaceae bacterium SKYG93]MCX8120586.1 hypothetical protein [Oscillatoriaceae bacterium SKW80]MDW8453877.1 hypothetical protein [Oscillatoriaceae cyanobacterium SKYGB_i_bin93]HIK27106.1 hypothetical protein [Oscillatoriaceae cyanobacterium M7585_C2015_266]
MAPPTLLQLAQQGDPQAIAALLNRELQPQGVTAKVAVRKDGLHVLLESPNQAPDRKKFVDTIRRQLLKWEPADIERVKIYGRQMGEKQTAWSQEFALEVGAYSMILASASDNENLSPAPAASENQPLQTSANKSQAKHHKIWLLVFAALATCVLVGIAAFFASQFLTKSGNKPVPQVENLTAPESANP